MVGNYLSSRLMIRTASLKRPIFSGRGFLYSSSFMRLIEGIPVKGNAWLTFHPSVNAFGWRLS